MVDCCHLKNR